MNIQTTVKDFISNGGQAVITEQDGQHGVLFTDKQNEFIPWGDLGYNSEIGFYPISEFPGEHNEVGVNFSAVRFETSDGESDYVMWGIVTDDGTDGFVIGEWGATVKLYQVLKTLVETGVAEEVDELDSRLGHPWLTPTMASEYALELGVSLTPRAIQYACQRKEIKRAEYDNGWTFPQRSFRNWLGNRPKPGPKPTS